METNKRENSNHSKQATTASANTVMTVSATTQQSVDKNDENDEKNAVFGDNDTTTQQSVDKSDEIDEKNAVFGDNDTNNAEALYQLGYRLLHGGNDCKIDKIRAAEVLTIAAKEFHHQPSKAKCVYEGWGGYEKDLQKAMNILYECVGRNQVETNHQTKLANYSDSTKSSNNSNSNIPLSPVPTLTLNLPNHNTNLNPNHFHPGAANSLGWCIMNDMGDAASAKPYFIRAAKSGDARAQCNLGRCLQAEGKYEAALDWYRRSASQGHASSVKLIEELEMITDR